MNSPNGEMMQVEGKGVPPEPFTSIGLRGDAAVELGTQMYTRGGASAVPLEDQLFGGTRSGEIFIQSIEIDGWSGSILFFEFPAVAEAQAGLQMARESAEGQQTEIRQRENFVAVVIGGSNASGKQQAFRKAAAQALDRQWGP